MKFILGTKLKMSQVFREDGNVVPVTKVKVEPCVVTQIKTVEKDNVASVQIGVGRRKEKNVTNPLKGHLKGLPLVKVMKDFRIEAKDSFERGDELTIESFKAGDIVAVTGVSKGRGFQGVVKRHGFHGHPASHGHKDQLRTSGSIGAKGIHHVFKGTRMAGRMGGDTVTVQNLEIISVDVANNELLVKGAIPGVMGSIVQICGQGSMQPVKTTKAETKVEAEEIKTEVTTEETAK